LFRRTLKITERQKEKTLNSEKTIPKDRGSNGKKTAASVHRFVHPPLVLSLFPGIGLLDRAFESEGFCVVRGPDVIWGGDVKAFHPPDGKFDGVIGGPPCQEFSELRKLINHNGHKPRFGNLIPEFARCVAEAKPQWFAMENVKAAPTPDVDGYDVWSDLICDYDVGGLTMRKRRWWFGFPTDANGKSVNVRFARRTLFPPERAVTGNSRVLTTGGRIRAKEKGAGPLPGQGKCTPIEEMCELQGLPRDVFQHSVLGKTGLRQAIGNGVPIAMGRAVARAIREAVYG
jgi:DNA (cytosine-5)-methyltransferase 1